MLSAGSGGVLDGPRLLSLLDGPIDGRAASLEGLRDGCNASVICCLRQLFRAKKTQHFGIKITQPFIKKESRYKRYKKV